MNSNTNVSTVEITTIETGSQPPAQITSLYSGYTTGSKNRVRGFVMTRPTENARNEKAQSDHPVPSWPCAL
jgi:hypothetical protein